MSKPEFSKTFNLEHAKAGAPYCCRDGEEAIVLKWDGRRFNEPLVGCIGADDIPASWGNDGRYVPDEHGPRQRDLVMLPLGFIDGKPVFVGDEVVDKFNGDLVPVLANWGGINTALWSWPAPAPVYPKTLISHVVLFGEYETSLRNRGYAEVSADSYGLAAIANFSLRHAIDAGQVVLPDVERELAVAHAVSKATFNAIYHNGTHRVAFCDLVLDIPAIISSVTGAKDAKEGAK